jgi:dTDP-glucose pyrophosphorylase
MSERWRAALLLQNSTIGEAAESLTNNSLRIVLVVDEKRRLLGSVTDGDIRRAVLSGAQLTDSVAKAMNRAPVTIEEHDVGKKALKIMQVRDLLQLPVVNAEGAVIGLETMQGQVLKCSRENPILLMAGGFGRRLHPLTQKVPKPLLTVGNKPILETILEQLVDEGFVQFFLSVHYRSDQIEAHFGDGAKWAAQITYLREEEPLGTAGAIGLLDRAKIDKPLIVMNGDLLTRLNFGRLADYHDDHTGSATICVREYDFQIPFGVVHGENNQLTEIIEKPVHTVFVNAGIYVLNPELLSLCDAGKPLDMPHLLKRAVANGEEIRMFPIHEYWLDIGRMEEYELAQNIST